VLRQGRRAVVFAGAISIAAAVPLVCAPLFIWHAVDVALRQASIDTLAPLGVLAALLLGARLALIAARDHLILRASLWFRHVTERRLLTASIGAVVTPRASNLARRAVLDVTAPASAAALTALVDLAGAVVATVVLALVHPWFGLLGAAMLLAGVVSLRVMDGAVRDRMGRLAEAEERAAEAFRVTAHNAGALAHHGLGDGMINDWQTLHATAVTLAYRIDRTAARIRLAITVLVSLLPVVTGIFGAWLVVVGGVSVGGAVAAGLLSIGLGSALQAAVSTRPDLIAGRLAVEHLSGVLTDTRAHAAPRRTADVPLSSRRERAS
jgi:ABC-type protease/lipase transport system fused ATPase/permease subunit